MKTIEKTYLWFRDLVSQPGERGLSSARYWQDRLRRDALVRVSGASGRLLEIGCGEGLFLEPLSRLNSRLRLFGIERQGKVLSGTKARLKGKVGLVSCDAGRLPFKDASFDWAVGVNLSICVGSAEAMAEILREAHRVLCPGAKLIIEFRNKGNIFLRLKYKLAKYYDSTTENHPLSAYYKEEVFKITREAGFGASRIKEIDFPLKGLPAIFILEAQRL